MQRKGFKSMLRDEWSILNTDGEVIGKVTEDSGILALIRRFLIKIIPQTLHVYIGTQEVGLIRQRFNLFILSYDVDFSRDESNALDRRLGVAMVVLLLAIEGRQR